MDPNASAAFRGPPSGAITMNGQPLSPGNQMAMPEPLRPSVAATRAEKYEDEKRRITATCFNKLDEQGKPLQSYITHIRVEEDSVYQSAPPPPNHPPQHKKPRVIIVAVKNNGRVTMHKARENDDTSFQIGKSWPMEELQSIESFTSSVPKTPEEDLRAKWAGPTGFIITMAKPYYWQAKTAKEKDFFIGSLVKIYNKYTEGMVPTLIGFEPRDRDQIIGATRPQQAFQSTPRPESIPLQETQPALQSPPIPQIQPVSQPSPIPQPAPLQPPPRSLLQEARPSSASPGPDGRSISANSSEFARPSIGVPGGPRAYPQQVPSPAQSPPPSQPPFRSRGPTPQLNQRPSQDRVYRPPQSQEQFRPSYAQSPPPPGPSPRLTPEGSRSNITDDLTGDPQLPVLSPRRQAERSRSKQDQRASPLPASPNLEPKPLSGSALPDRWRLANDSSRSISDRIQSPPPSSTSKPTDSVASSTLSARTYGSADSSLNGDAQVIPERRRPPMKDSPLSSSQRTYPTASGRSSPRPMSPPSAPLGPSVSNERSFTSSTIQLSPSDSPAVTPTVQTPAIEDAAPSDSKSDLNVSSVSRDGGIVQDGNQEQTQKSVEPSPSPAEGEAEQYRPGLGPMLSKRAEVAGKMRKAVIAHTAFKPRAGGAGERLLGAKAKTTNEPDGITGVVPARSAARVSGQDDAKPPIGDQSSGEKSLAPAPLDVPQGAPPVQVLATSTNEPPAPIPDLVQSREVVSSEDAETFTQPLPQRPSRSPSRQPKRRRSNPFANALAGMDIDQIILGRRELDFDDILAEFGWNRNFLHVKKMDALEADLRREVGRLEAGSWLGHSDQKDERVEVVEKLLDKAIAECDEMEGLLTLYSVELNTLTDDIAYIEAQSQGLQVQTANQKLLQRELETLIKTISLDAGQMESLRASPLGDIQGLESIESCLLLLYKALRTMDPAAVYTNSSVSREAGPGSMMKSMRALQERKESYTAEAGTFLHRLRHYMDPTFGAAFHKTKDAQARTSAPYRDNLTSHDLARTELWRYSPIMLFAKEVNRDAWEDMLRSYQGRAREIYLDELHDSAAEWKRRARKMTGEEQEALFTAQEKESEGLTSTARKLTVKRSQTLARSLRQAASEKKSTNLQSRDGNQFPFEVFAGALTEMVPLIAIEQNFFVDFFHATTLQDVDFSDAVLLEPPSARRGTDLSAERPLEPDRATAKRVIEAMENIFSSWPTEMQSLIDWAIKEDQFQGVGILCSIERALQEYTDSSQEFIVRTLTRLHDTIGALFTRFVDDQVRAIEATKVKIRKRKGVMAFIKVFPNFSAIVENMLSASSNVAGLGTGGAGAADLEIRTNVDNAYDRINKAMFSSLKQIAKEVPTSIATAPINGMMSSGAANSNADPEDKEALNHEILLIENMFHYYTEVEERSSAVLGVWRGKAMLEMSEHQDRYVNAVIRRPLGRLLDFLEGLESLGLSASVASEHSTYSRAAFKKLISSYYDSREFRRGIDALRKRVEKHFGESSEDVALNQKLVAQILAECERKYVDVVERVDVVRRDVYGGEVDVEFARSDVTQGFRR